MVGVGPSGELVKSGELRWKGLHGTMREGSKLQSNVRGVIPAQKRWETLTLVASAA